MRHADRVAHSPEERQCDPEVVARAAVRCPRWQIPSHRCLFTPRNGSGRWIGCWSRRGERLGSVASVWDAAPRGAGGGRPAAGAPRGAAGCASLAELAVRADRLAGTGKPARDAIDQDGRCDGASRCTPIAAPLPLRYRMVQCASQMALVAHPAPEDATPAGWRCGVAVAARNRTRLNESSSHGKGPVR
jgi:hypothetical protein